MQAKLSFNMSTAVGCFVGGCQAAGSLPRPEPSVLSDRRPGVGIGLRRYGGLGSPGAEARKGGEYGAPKGASKSLASNPELRSQILISSGPN
jgi:hypothetical protein